MLGETISHYRILEKLGQGGMGEVYRARDTRLHRDVAIKVLPSRLLSDPDLRSRFRKEALSLSRLNHPNIATIHDFDSEGGTDFLVMELIEGTDLGSMIADRRSRNITLDQTECLRLGDAIAAALEDAHEQGVIHRDLKPQNVMVTPKGQTKVLDFGLAKLTNPGSGDATAVTMTQTGAVMGTLPYMAPEQIQGLPVDSRVDVYAWGATMYELVTGARTFGKARGSELIAAVVRDAPRSPRDLNPELAPWLEKMIVQALHKNPSDRQQSIKEIRAEIAQHSSGETLVVRRIESPVRLGRNHVVGILALLLIAGLAWVLNSTFQPSTAVQSSLAILPFENIAESNDPNRLGEIVGSLLTTSLGEQQSLTLVSRERLLQLIRGAGAEDLTTVDRSIAVDASKRAGGGTLLVGEILQVAPRYVLTSQLVDLENGEVLAAQRVDGGLEQDIFAVVDQLSRTIRSNLGTHDTVSTEQRRVSEVSSASLEAQRHYLDGLRFRLLNYHSKARASFHRAIEADSTFAMAHLYLGQIDEASRYADTAPTRDRRLIRALELRHRGIFEDAVRELEALSSDYPQEMEYHRQMFNIYFEGATGDPRDPLIDLPLSLQAAQKQLELDPLDGWAHHQQFYSYFSMGDWENSLRTLDSFVALGEANAYDDLGDFYAWRGQFQNAVEPFQTALKMNSTYTTLVKAGFLHLKLRNYDRARDYWRQLATHEEAYPRRFGKRLLLILPMYQGRLNEALDQTSATISGAELLGENGPEYRRMLVYRSQILGELGRWDEALEDCAKAVASLNLADSGEAPWNWYTNVLLRTLAKSGDIAAADALLADHDDSPDRGDPYTLALAQVELFRGDAEAAYALLKPFATTSTTEFRMQSTLDNFIGDPYVLGLACLETGRVSEAIEQFQSLDTQYYGRVALQPLDEVRVPYYLGIAYEQSGWADRAVEEYREFLAIWNDADPGLQDVDDARRRLASLNN